MWKSNFREGGKWLLRIEIENMLKNKTFYISVILMWAALYIGIYQERSSDILYLFENTTTIGFVHMLLPALVSLPYVAKMSDEINTYYYRYIIVRSSVKHYFFSRVYASIISAVLVCSVSESLWIMGIVVLRGGYVGSGMDSEYLIGSFYESFYKGQNYIVPLICKMYAFSISGIMWTLFSLLIACFTNNKYVVIAGPFLAQSALNFCTELLDLPILNPGLLLLKGPIYFMPGGGLVHITLYQCFAGSLFGGLSWIIIKRRIHNG